MSSPTGTATTAPATTAEHRRVLAGTLVGTTIEWYDFLIYAQAAGLVFSHSFFAPVAEENPGLAQIFAWATLGISFLFRPLGATVAGHLGDRLGRRAVLVYTLIGMGLATVLIGILPTYQAIGAAAPLLLLLLRILQGLFAGGEWGGAALMSVEHAPRERRAFYGSFPQVGVPLGLSLATAVMLGVMTLVGTEAYVEWGWRLPFLFSAVLIGVGLLIRLTVDESPVFVAMRVESRRRSAPLRTLLREHPVAVIRGAFVFAGHQATGYLVIAFLGSYAVTSLQMEQTVAWTGTLVGGLTWTAFVLVSGLIADRFGTVRTFVVGYVLLVAWVVPMWWIIDTARPVLFVGAIVVLTVPLALTLGPLPALFAPMFPAAVRYSGVSLAYAIGAVLGGAFAPMIAQIIFDATGKSWLIGVYIAGLSIPALVALATAPRGLDDTPLEA